MVERPSRRSPTASGSSSISGQQRVDSESSAALFHLLRDPVIEVFPMPGIEERTDILPRGSSVAVTCSPRGGIEPTLELTEHLVAQGLRVVPHISARSVTNHAHLRNIVKRLAALDVTEVFVIGGDAKDPAGVFESAFQLLSAMADLGDGLKRVGVAAYPEGHPAIADDRLLQALVDKQPLATHMVTQMCFDADALVGWLGDVRRLGIELPADIGLPGAVKIQRLLRFSLRVGVKDSIRFLTKQTGLMTRLVSSATYTPEGLVAAIARHAGDATLRIRGLHLYTFNQLQRTEEWRLRMVESIVDDEGDC